MNGKHGAAVVGGGSELATGVRCLTVHRIGMLGFPYIKFEYFDKKYGRADIFLMSHLRNHIRQHRARLDLTQEDLGSRVGVRRQTILAIEKGQYVPSTLLAFKIADQLGMKVDALFELVSDEEAEE